MITPGKIYQVKDGAAGLFGRDDMIQIIRVESGLVDYLYRREGKGGGIECRIRETLMQGAIDGGELAEVWS